MDTIVPMLLVVNLVVSAITLMIVGYQKVMGSEQPPGASISPTVMRKSSGRTKPRWNDEAKEYLAEKKELSSRPPM